MANQRGIATTLKDVAREAGTSTAVVSYVMNNGPRPVAPETRERVLAAAARLNYRPNRIARALRVRTSGVVGLVLADASNPYFAALAREIEHALEGRDKLTLTGNAGYSAARQTLLVGRFLDAQVDGLIIVSAEGATDVAAAARTMGVPIVYVHHRPTHASAPTIAADNNASVRAAIAHLQAHGHTQIGFLAGPGPSDQGPVAERHAAWRSAVGVEAPLLRSDYTRAAADALTRHLIGKDALPAALITATDEQAIGVLAGAAACGRPIPGKLAVISLDGTPDSAYTAPPLTVIAQPLRKMAEQAVNLLFDADTPDSNLKGVLIERRSC